jgi:hypothetical protein
MRVRNEPFDLAHEVAGAMGVRCHVVAGATLIACDEAEAFPAGCPAAKVHVIGVEGFDLIDGNRRSDMGAILDLGDLADPVRSAAEARQFVVSVCRDGVLLEFQLERSSPML